MRILLPVGAVLALVTLPAFADDAPRGPWARLEAMDADGDGRVSRAEFRGPERVFRRLDADGDGLVTQAEATARRRGGRGEGRGGSGAWRERARGPTLEVLDTDGDGRLSAAEWSAFFARADENGDGILQPEEWTAVLAGRGVHDPAPRVGAPAPPVRARMLDARREVDLGAPRRPTVLVFGSHT